MPATPACHKLGLPFRVPPRLSLRPSVCHSHAHSACHSGLRVGGARIEDQRPPLAWIDDFFREARDHTPRPQRGWRSLSFSPNQVYKTPTAPAFCAYRSAHARRRKSGGYPRHRAGGAVRGRLPASFPTTRSLPRRACRGRKDPFRDRALADFSYTTLPNTRGDSHHATAANNRLPLLLRGMRCFELHRAQRRHTERRT